jgi:hypothetical protein
MIKQRLHEGHSLNATLIYTNRDAIIPFHGQLADWQASTGLTIIHTTKPISARLIAENVTDLAKSVIYLSGPQPIIELLLPPHNLPTRQLKHDVFSNYTADSY